MAQMKNNDTRSFGRVEGRRFGFTVGSAFLVLAAILSWRTRDTAAYVLGAIGGLLVVGGLLVPASLRPVYRAWMAFAMALSKITTPIFMGVIYFLVLAPVGVIRRTFGKNPLRHEAEGGSYWKIRSRKKDEQMRQF